MSWHAGCGARGAAPFWQKRGVATAAAAYRPAGDHYRPGALTAFKAVGLEPGLLTIVVGHATFCVVVVFNNVIARFRRTSWSMVEASMDLGATGWQTFRYVVLPNLGSALLAGGMLAFALSF